LIKIILKTLLSPKNSELHKIIKRFRKSENSLDGGDPQEFLPLKISCSMKAILLLYQNIGNNGFSLNAEIVK